MTTRQMICWILIGSHILTIIGCTSEVTRYREVQVPHEENVDVPYSEEVSVQKFRDIPRVFPLPEDRPMLLAVLPFTSSTGYDNDGIEVAEEIEYGMQKHPLAEANYRLLNRTQLNAVFTEKELAGLDVTTIKKTRRLLNVEGLITGHIRSKGSGQLSFILKAINTEDASVLFTQRFEGDYHQTIQDVVGVFYEHRIPDGWETKTITKYKIEKKTTYETEKEPYKVEEFDQGKFWGGLIVIGIIVYIASQKKDEKK
jgi:hypothetical protein